MAITNSVNTYSASQSIGSQGIPGTREDLSDLIANISPTDFPFLNMCRKDKATNTYTEWQMDSLAAPITNAAVDGADITTIASFAPTTRVGNYTQIFTKAVSVSNTEQSTLKAGRGKDELAYQLTKRTKELKRDIEFALINSTANAAGSGTVARTTRGLAGWIDSNGSIGTGGTAMNAYSVNAARTTLGANRSLTEGLIRSVIQSCFQQGGEVDILMTNPIQRQIISTFTGVTTTGVGTRFQDASDTKLVSTISIYESDYGTLKVVANRFQDIASGTTTPVVAQAGNPAGSSTLVPNNSNGGTVYVLDSSKVAVAFLRNYTTFDLATTGDATQKALVAELTLKIDSNIAHGSVRDLTQ